MGWISSSYSYKEGKWGQSSALGLNSCWSASASVYLWRCHILRRDFCRMSWFRSTCVPDSLTDITGSKVSVSSRQARVYDLGCAGMAERFDVQLRWFEPQCLNQFYRIPAETWVCLPPTVAPTFQKYIGHLISSSIPIPFNRTLQANQLPSVKLEWVLFAEEGQGADLPWKLKPQGMNQTTTQSSTVLGGFLEALNTWEERSKKQSIEHP